MLKIHVLGPEHYDEDKNEFYNEFDYELILEHSLASISEWESTFHKTFINNDEKSYEETIAYIKLMTLNTDINPIVYDYISTQNVMEIKKYIDDSRTSLYFENERPNTLGGDTITHEIIYYWMVELNIPFECQNWHINNLLNLVKVCMRKKAKPKKTGKRELMSKWSSINEARKAALNSKG